jgi:RNA polymerase sigma-70 factor (ECF subfamily)
MSQFPGPSPRSKEDGAVTELLAQWKMGDQNVLDQLTPLIYNDLVRLAKTRLRYESNACTLQPTALVHEAYLRLAGQHELRAENRIHFYAIAANTMRRVLIEHARRRHSQKRHGGVQVTFHPDLSVSESNGTNLFVLDDALQKLMEVDARKAQIIELKFFGGLTTEEIATVKRISVATVGRELRMGQAWLRREMSPEHA